MSDVAIVFLVIVLIVIIVVVLAILNRIFGLSRLASCFSSSEEKAILTKHEQYNGYIVGLHSSEMYAEGDRQYAANDTPQLEPGFVNIESHSSSKQESERSSPVSVGMGSLASDPEFSHSIRRAESCESVASDSSVLELQPDKPKLGQIEFALEYDREVSELIMSIIQARDLTANQYTGTLDTYIRGILLPDKAANFQTKVQRNTTEPVYKERFLFSVEQIALEEKILQLQLCAVDNYQRHTVIGETELRIGDIDLRTPIKLWLNLRDINEKPTEFGDIMFSLSYLPTAERLTVVIVKARNLKWTGGKDSGDPFVKVYLLQKGKKVSKKKTTVKCGEPNPIFNEAMIFAVPATTLPTVQLRITVAELMSDNRTPSLGHVIVGANTSGTELSHWNQMMTSLRKPIAMWHYLRK